MLVIDLPLFLASSFSISSFYLVAQRSLNPKGWKRMIVYVPFVMAVGIGISVRNAIAVIEAIRGKQSDFARTPKRGTQGRAGNIVSRSYRNRSGWLPFLEIGLGFYFMLTIVYAAINRSYATIPFLLLFVWGYLYTGFMSLGQSWLERFRFRSAPVPSVPPAEPQHATTVTSGF
jgi:hypothetical protein